MCLGCSSGHEEKAEHNDVDSVETPVVEDNPAMNEVRGPVMEEQIEASRLSELLTEVPEKWIHVSEHDGKLVRYLACDAASIPRVEFLNNKTEMLIVDSHGAAQYEIRDCSYAESGGNDGTKNRHYAFVLVTLGGDQLRPELIYKVGGVSTWTDAVQEGPMQFVSDEQQEDYPLIEQPCEECNNCD